MISQMIMNNKIFNINILEKTEKLILEKQF